MGVFKSKIENLRDQIRAKSSHTTADLNALEEAVTSCQRYVDYVVTMERIMTIQRHRLDAEEYRSTLQGIDQRRRQAHESLMAQMTMINRMGNLYGVEQDIFVFADRYEAAEIAQLVVNEYFEGGKSKKG